MNYMRIYIEKPDHDENVILGYSKEAEEYLTDKEMEYLQKLAGKIQRRIKQGKDWKAKAALRASKKAR